MIKSLCQYAVKWSEYCFQNNIRKKDNQKRILNKVKAPWIKHFYYTDDNCYIIPNVNTVCLGGTRNYNNFSLEINEDDSKGIMERCKRLCPSLEVYLSYK